MTRQDFSKFVMDMQSAYPREKVLPTESSVDLWYRVLGDLPYEVAATALAKHVLTSVWPPSIAEIRKLAMEVSYEPSPDWSEAWQIALKAVAKFGQGDEVRAMEWLGLNYPQAVYDAVRRFGFKQLCNMPPDEKQIYMAQFRDIYKQIDARQKEDALLPENLRFMIETTQHALEKKKEAYSIEFDSLPFLEEES